MPASMDTASPRATAVHSLFAGSLASLLSGAVLAWAGRRQNASAAAPLNAVSHWYWGDAALQHDSADLLSMGKQQRLALARVLAHQPGVDVLD